jgi:4-amino-4-deoxy-L-arabinose transferase-like glycosyltransferase
VQKVTSSTLVEPTLIYFNLKRSIKILTQGAILKISRDFKNKYLPLLSLVLLWILSILISDTSGNFPLNDDWSFALPVKTLLEKGVLELTGWTSMTLIAQVYWGYLWVLVTGFSFDTLRISTQFLSIMGLIFFYLSAAKMTKNRAVLILSFFILAFNPLYYILSSSFMTDVPFVALFIISLYFFIKFLDDSKGSSFLFAFLFCVLAVFIRQTGLILMISFSIAYLFKSNVPVVKKTIPFILTLVILLLLVLFQKIINIQTETHLINNTRTLNLLSNLSPKHLFGIIPIVKNSFFALIYIGLFIYPFIIFNYSATISYLSKDKQKRILFISILFSLFILIALTAVDKILPARPNTFYHYGLGPALLRDVDILELENINSIPSFIWYLLTFIGINGAFFIMMVLITSIYRFIKNKIVPDSIILLLFCTTILMLLMTGLSDFYDRYLIIFIPLLILLLIGITGIGENRTTSLLKKSAFVLIFAVMLFSVLSTHDYFAWNNSRWKAIDYLTQDLKVLPENIDGGFEFNGLYTYDPEYIPSSEKSWWWVKDDEYIIAFGNIGGYSPVKSFNYYSWLYLSVEKIYILNRN